MKKLTTFQKFDFNAFQQGKEFLIASIKFNEAKGCPTLDIAIVEDESGENLYEKFKVHCVQDSMQSGIDKYPVGARIQFKQVGKCSVYGEYNSNLSVETVVEVIK